MKQKNLMFGVLAVLCVTVLWFQFLYKPMGAKASKANEAAANAETRVQSLEAEKKRLTGGSTGTKDKEAALAEMETAIPKTDQLAEFLVQFDDIKAQSGVAFQTIVPSPPSAELGTSSINLGITVQGTYAQVMDYVDRVSKLKRLVIVDSISQTAGAAEGGATGATAEGGPTGEVFAGQGAAPMIQLQLTARIFTTAGTIAAAGTTGGPAGAGASTTQTPNAAGGDAPTGVQNN